MQFAQARGLWAAGLHDEGAEVGAGPRRRRASRQALLPCDVASPGPGLRSTDGEAHAARRLRRASLAGASTGWRGQPAAGGASVCLMLAASHSTGRQGEAEAECQLFPDLTRVAWNLARKTGGTFGGLTDPHDESRKRFLQAGACPSVLRPASGRPWGRSCRRGRAGRNETMGDGAAGSPG